MKEGEDNSVVLNDEQLVYLWYYEKLTKTPISELVQKAVEDWLDASYVVDVGRIEEERGLPSNFGI